MKFLILSRISLFIIFMSCLALTPSHQVDDRAFKQEFLDRINIARQKGCNCGHKFYPPAPPMTWNDQLEDAARGHALDMDKRNYFSHTSKDGRSMSDRIVQAGYYFKGFKSFTVGENIAQGQMSIAEVMAGWLKSEGHCRNLMNPDFKEVGISEVDHYWVQDFGGREPFSEQEQKLIKSGKYRLIQKEVSKGH
jgi:uncharacterized protein YkwD